MQNVINNIVVSLQEIISTSPMLISVIIAMMVILIESILPILPLGVFIALSIHLFGGIQGFFMSWVATSIGCLLSFYIVRRLFDRKMEKKVKENEKVERLMKKINKLSFSKMVLIMTLPFTPAFLLNIAAGLSKKSIREFASAVLVSKMFIVIFWGYIGTSLLTSITDIRVIIKVLVMLILAYVISKVLMKKFNLE